MDTEDTGEVVQEKSFAEFMAENPVGREWLRPGQRVNAAIVKITPEWIFIDLGGKSEGYLDSKEFLDGEGKFTVKEGDTIRVYFLSSKNNEKFFTTKVGKGEAGKAYLEDAWRSGIPVEGRVAKETKGGLEVIIAGDIRAFCPFSQTGLSRNDNVSEYVGRTLPFKIMEYGENGRNVVLSHRAILEEEKTKHKEELMVTLKEGMTIQGRVISIHNFGAFVDVGGIQGLLPLSEIGWNRGDEIKNVLAIGEELSLYILKLDWAADKITLSRKAILPDPWADIENNLPKGSCHAGRVISLTDFGAFVTLETGVDGLVHISSLAKGKRLKHVGEVLAKGQVVQVRIEAVDTDRKRLSLSLADSEEEKNEGKPDDYHKYLGGPSRALGSWGDVLKSRIKPH